MALNIKRMRTVSKKKVNWKYFYIRNDNLYFLFIKSKLEIIINIALYCILIFYHKWIDSHLLWQEATMRTRSSPPPPASRSRQRRVRDDWCSPPVAKADQGEQDQGGRVGRQAARTCQRRATWATEGGPQEEEISRDHSSQGCASHWPLFGQA